MQQKLMLSTRIETLLVPTFKHAFFFILYCQNMGFKEYFWKPRTSK